MGANLKEKTISGLFWSGFGDVVNKGIGFLFGIVLARMLSPADYGLTAMIGVFMGIASAFVESGFKSALVRKPDLTEDDYSTAFYFNIFVSLLCYVVLFVISPLIANFYDKPILSSILRVQALSIIINAFTIVQYAIFSRSLNFKSQSKVLVISNIVSCIIGVIFAFMHHGVWALVAMNVSYSFVSACLLWYISPWHPLQRFSKSSFKYLYGYGSKLLASGLLNTIFSNINPIVIGKLFPASDLGYYTKSLGIADIPSTNVTVMIQRVTFPVLSQIQNDLLRLQIGYRKLIRMSAYIVFPLSICLAAVSLPLVSFLYGDKWAPCVPYLQIICLSAMWYPLQSLNLNLLQIKGRSDLFLRLEIIKKVFAVVVIFCSVPFGVLGICFGGVVSSLVSLIINTYYTRKLISVGFFTQMKDISGILVNSFIMGCIAFIFTRFTSVNLINVIIGSLAGAIYYLLSSYFRKSEELKEVLGIFKHKRFGATHK